MKSKLVKRLGVGLFGASLLALGLSAQANLITIDSTLNRATVNCTAGAVDPACEGVIGSPPGSLSTVFADIYDSGSSSEEAETNLLNSLMGAGTVNVADATRIDTGGVDSTGFVTSAAWFGIKTGLGISYFRNNGGLIDLNVLYQKNTAPGPNPPGKGMGISHVTFWGGTTTVPEPGTLALLGAGLLGLAWLRRRRRV